MNCGLTLQKKSQKKYCTNKCQADFQYQKFITLWKMGNNDGARGKKVRNFSRHVKRYLDEKYARRCAKCGWNERHKRTGLVPLEINHIDGNSENNKEENLELICPNCHALTSNFRNLNRGRGRTWRRFN